MADAAPTVRVVGRLETIPMGEGRCIRVGSKEIAIFRVRSGEVFAIQSTCPHRGGPLADGITGAGVVTCPMHGFAFNLATGDPIGNSCEALRTFPIEISESGEVSVIVPPTELEPALTG